MADLLHKLAEYRSFTALVVGDFMLDEQVHGAAERLSPDAPVPVLHQSRVEQTPGGAANVAVCLRELKGEVLCFGVVGYDDAGSTLRRVLKERGCDVGGVITDPARPTTIKRSLIGLAQHRHPQKMFRVDIESHAPIDDEIMQRIVSRLSEAIDRADVVCIEDYNKGVCTPELCQAVIACAAEHGKPVLVDPAAIDDYEKYRGATAITPNRSEAELATHLDQPIEATDDHNAMMTRSLLAELDLTAVVLTLDKSGAMLAIKGSEPTVVPTVARSVYDVTGAGDMVLASLAGAVANGFGWIDAVRFANAAAGLEVEMFGAQPIPLASVRQSLLAQVRQLNGKVRLLEELLIELEVHRESGDRIVLTNGCFDVIHAGHVAYLREAKSLGDVLVVAVNADAQVRAQKGEGRPVYCESDRLEILDALSCVDYLLVFHEPTARRVIETVRPHVYVKGGDYAPQDVNEFDVLKPMMARGEIEFRTLQFRTGLSSTGVIERLRRAEAVESVARP